MACAATVVVYHYCCSKPREQQTIKQKSMCNSQSSTDHEKISTTTNPSSTDTKPRSVGMQSPPNPDFRGPQAKIVDHVCRFNGMTVEYLSHGFITKITSPSTGHVEYLKGSIMSCNSGVASSLAKDKAATHEVLKAHGVPSIPGKLISSKGLKPSNPRAATWTRLLKLLKKSQPNGLVLKPNAGGGGADVFHCVHERELELAWRALPDTFMVSDFYEIQTEIRAFVVYGKLMHCFAKVRPKIVGDGKRTVLDLAIAASNKSHSAFSEVSLRLLNERGSQVLAPGEELELDWQHNLSHGAVARTLEMSSALVMDHIKPIAESAAKALTINWCTVDIVAVMDTKTSHKTQTDTPTETSTTGQSMAAGKAQNKTADAGEVADMDTGKTTTPADANKYFVLEVNSGPGIAYYLKTNPQHLGIFYEMMTFACSRLFDTPFKVPPVPQ